ncbi:MAG TPA: 2Fe-2S iron-sulfur cluster-binding protein [Acidobacteriaceae bacterium]|nr:2Fe-2S iron-sulfur cluster-binding protein [Acidobacteriaceae bacterium]
MPETISLTINGKPIAVSPGTTAAVAIALAGANCRTSVTGQPRGPLCAMGICFECRAMVDGVPHQRTCQILCTQAMDVRTQ